MRRLYAVIVVIVVCGASLWSLPAKDDSSADGGAASAASSISVQPQRGQCPANPKALQFELQTIQSATQPYIAVPLVPTGLLPILYSGEDLFIQVHATAQQAAELPLLTIAIDFSKADTINTAPVRPTFAPAAAAVAYERWYCLRWPRKVAGDSIPKITIQGLYQPRGMPDAAKEKNLTLVTASYPQVHNLYRYNVATGVVVSSLHNPTFNRVQSALASGGTPAQFTTSEDKGDYSVAPVLMFSAYLFRAMDSESHWTDKDLIPAPTVGFSLSAPADNFYFGGSSEILRNVQVVYGYHLGRVTHLIPTLVNDPTSSAAPMTTKNFSGGAFVGMTFNIDFIKGLFGGSK